MSTPPQGEGWRPGDPHGSGPPWQQGPWLHPPGPPPPTGNGLKWLLGAVAVLLVIAIAVGITVIVMSRGEDSAPSAPPTGAVGDFASAYDIGPVSIITDEPTCKTFLSINNSLGDVQRNGWSDSRETLGPAAEWTADQRSQTQAVVSAMRTASDQIAPLAKQTPHRVVRELYEQFIAYGRAYADSLTDYIPQNDSLASANINVSAALFGICESIEYGSASRSIAVPALDPPRIVTKPQDPVKARPFITSSDEACKDWSSSADEFNDNTSAWQKLDPNSPNQWNPEQRGLQQAAMPFVSTWAQDMEEVGRQSGNPVFDDLATTAAAYLQGYVSAGDSYIGADGWLRYVAYKINQTILSACNAVER